MLDSSNTFHVSQELNLTAVFGYAAAVSQWSFLTNHSLVLLCVAVQPGTRLRDVAECVGITERAAHRLLCELEESGYLIRHKLGRRNFYEIDATARLRHPLEEDISVGDLLRPFLARKMALAAET